MDDEVLPLQNAGQVGLEVLRVEQLAEHDGLLLVLIGIDGRDAAQRGAVLLIFQAGLLQTVERAVEGEDDGGTLRDLQILRRDADAVRTEIVDLAAQVFQIDDDAVAEHIHNALGENTGRDEMQGKLAVLIDDGMTGVVAALIANDNIIILCDEVDHAALAFIAPVDADDCTIAHNISAPVSAQWA